MLILFFEMLWQIVGNDDYIDSLEMINLNLEIHKFTTMPFVFDVFKNSCSNFHPLKASI